jgi:hypothetical protein
MGAVHEVALQDVITVRTADNVGAAGEAVVGGVAGRVECVAAQAAVDPVPAVIA